VRESDLLPETSCSRDAGPLALDPFSFPPVVVFLEIQLTLRRFSPPRPVRRLAKRLLAPHLIAFWMPSFFRLAPGFSRAFLLFPLTILEQIIERHNLQVQRTLRHSGGLVAEFEVRPAGRFPLPPPPRKNPLECTETPKFRPLSSSRTDLYLGPGVLWIFPIEDPSMPAPGFSLY